MRPLYVKSASSVSQDGSPASARTWSSEAVCVQPVACMNDFISGVSSATA